MGRELTFRVLPKRKPADEQKSSEDYYSSFEFRQDANYLEYVHRNEAIPYGIQEHTQETLARQVFTWTSRLVGLVDGEQNPDSPNNRRESQVSEDDLVVAIRAFSEILHRSREMGAKNKLIFVEYS